MSLKKSLMKQGMKLMTDPRVMKMMQDPRVMKAVMAAMSMPGKVQTFGNEQVEKIAKAMALATEDELTRELEYTRDVLRRQVHLMLRHFPGVQRWEQTDDVVQNALVRLWNALRDVRPPSAREFAGLTKLVALRAGAGERRAQLARLTIDRHSTSSCAASTGSGGHSTCRAGLPGAS